MKLAVSFGLRLVPIGNPCELRVRGDLALDFDLPLREVRGNVALGLAGFLLEREGVLEHLDLEAANEALEHVATELVVPFDEFKRVWCAQDGDLEAVDQHFAKHVPSAWVVKLAERIEQG
jgi:hypothetical protein